MRHTKPVSFFTEVLVYLLVVLMAVPNVVMADAVAHIGIARVGVGGTAPPGTTMNFQLKLQSDTNGVAYVIQTSRDLSNWRTLLSVKPDPTNQIAIPISQTTNDIAFFRLQEFLSLTVTNPPVWPDGVGAQSARMLASNLWAQWNPASNSIAVAQYRVFVNGSIVTNVFGHILSCQLAIDPHSKADIRIQAVDALDNASDIVSLLYLPGDNLLAISDDDGRVYISHVQATGAFTAPREIANFSSYNRGLALGDFDRDGFQDLIAAKVAGQVITPFFFKGKGDGSFADGVPLPSASGAASYVMDATAGDFDCDGNLDFIVGGNDRYVFFYWGRGNGTFALERRDLGDYGRGMDAGDFNEDGREDFVRATYSDGNVRLYLSNGDRTFGAPIVIPHAGGDVYGLAAGDFDEDGHLDLLVNNRDSGEITFLKGLGNGTFTDMGPDGPRANLNVGNYATLDAYDYNGDGHLDLVMATHTSRTVYFWAGNGDGTFSTNRITLASGLGNSLGISAPPLPPRRDVSIAPIDGLTKLNQALSFLATGSGVATNDFFRWTFGDQSTNPFAWNFTTNMTNMGPSVSHAYSNEGRFLTRLLHTTTNDINSARGTWVTATGEPPVARPGGPYAFGEVAATQGIWYATVDGSASSDDFGIDSYIWTFGDGASLTNGPIVSHAWTNKGLWNVGLSVIDKAGQTDSNSTTVTFSSDAPPVAVITGPNLVDETSALNGVWSATFYATNSTDDIGIWKYNWNFGNGTTGTGISPQAAFSAVGSYNVTLTVTDNAGQTASTNFAVVVKANDLSTPVITGPRLVTEASATNHVWSAAWDGSGSSDDRGIYRYNWSFGDGATGSGAKTTHGYAATGLYSLVLTVTDFGNQTASTTQNVAVIAGDPPVVRITATNLSPEGAQPITLSGLTSSDDRGIVSFRWILPPRRFNFDGQFLDLSQWSAANARQDEKLIITGNVSWGQSYFFSPNITLQRGATMEGRVDTSSGTSYAMVGLKDLNNASGHYADLVYAIYFCNGDVRVYEYNNDRGSVGKYSPGSSYDFRIETKPGAGARYFLRSSDQGAPFVKVFETDNYADSSFSFGADVYSGVFAFDDLVVDGVFSTSPEITTSVFPGGPVTLEVVDHAGQTNSASVVVNPITGAPPVDIISGPTNASAGVELAYHAYLSTDDHGIVSYAWDFGDNSALQFGPAVSHRYDAPGIYTNTLTVLDYAGQQASSSVLVFVGSGNQLVCVPWRIIGGVEYPHETYAGKTITLKAVARGLPMPFDYTWDFGDGSATVTNTATTAGDAYGLQSSHAYSGADGTPFYATVRVVLTNGTVLSDTYSIQLLPKSLQTEINVAIDEGLWYLHKTQTRYDIDAQNKGGYWRWKGSYTMNVTASAVQSMAVNGHLVTDDSSRDPYVETVQRGINYLLANLTSSAIGVQRFGDPDGNHNGIGLSVPGDRPVYETGPVMDALVAATRKELVATVGEPNVKGRALYDIMQDLVDMYCWGQSDADWGGGWRYSWNSDADNSACQWAAIGLMAAERYWGIAAPDWVKQRNLVWLNTSKGGSGFGYAGAGDGEATTPSGLVQAAFDGVKNTDTLWLHGENYVANNWTSLMNNNNLYAHYATVKALRAANPPVQKLTATGLDWFLDSSVGLGRNTIDRQHADGSWLSNDGNANDPSMSTAWSVMILSSSLFQRGPVAIASARPNPTAVGFPVVLDGRGSFHQHPALKVAEYRWDFDASDGLDFDHPDAVGAVVTNKFGHYGTNVVTLQVRDNGTPQLSSTASIEVRATLPPYPPTPDAGGPYLACAGETIHLDGSGSFDVDAAQGDYIQSYDWEISFQMPLDFNDGVTGAHAVITNGFATSGQHRIGLRVKDATSIVFPQLGKADMTSDAFTIAYVYDRIITNLVGRAKDNMIQLVWTKAGDYAVIQRSTLGPDRGFQEIGRTDSSYATFLDTNVDYNVSYYYRLYAYQAGHADPLGISDAAYVVSIPRSFESCGPYFTAYPPREIAVGKLYEVALQARERQNNPFGFALLLGPTNMTLDAASGIVRFTPTIDQLGGNLVSFAVTNSCGTNVLPFTLTVFNVTNLPPLATANGPYTGVAGLPLQFSSVGTRDPDTNALTYVWVFGDGVIDTNANPTHAYPAQGDYSVSLYVNDGHGGTATAYTRATISRANRIPIAKAGADQMPLVGQTVMLDGSGSWDADLDPLTYRWDVVLRPTNSVSLLTNSTTARPSLLIDQPGFYVVRLTVNDGLADSDPDAVTLVTANSVPIANAGSNQRVLEGQTARLDGTRSYDVDHNPLTYRWTLLSVPVGSAAALTNANTATPTFGLDVYGLYIAQLIVNDGLVDSAPARVRVTTGNLLPEIVSAPSGTNAVFGYTWNYNVLAYDPDGTNLTFTLAQAPTGMTLTPQPPVIEFGETNSALISWTPTLAQEGAHPVRIRVTDADGASVEQAFTLVASRDTEPPQVSLALVQGQINPNNGQWSATLNSTAIIRVTATDNVEVTSLTLRVGSHLVPLNSSGVGSFVATNTGILQVVATASDAEGNVGTNTQTLYVRDPNAVSAVAVQIHSPTNTATITAPVGIYASITSAIPLSVCSLEYARLDSGTIDDSVSLSDPSLHYQSITNLIIPPGTLVLSNINVGRFDPTLLANDAYIIRLTALDMNLNGAMEGALVYVSGNLKYGEFHLDFTDLSVPVAGIPITITRSYDTRESTRQGDFGYGWTLGLADGHIVKSAMKYGFGLMGDERTLTTRTRVYITKPDGRRVGFTVKPEIPAGDGLMGYPPGYTLLFGQLYTPGFEPDPGVYDKLEAVGAPDLIISSDGAMVYPLFSFMGFDPDTFRLTTKDGTVYEYSQSQGLKNVTDLNTNRLVFTRDGIYHFSSGSTNYDQSVPFIRDAQGRISEIIDPAGNRITYAYDAQGDLRSFTDQVTNVTQYLYSTARAHYLTNIIDSLGRNALRLEYDSAGRLVGIRDALGNLTSQDFPDPNTAVFKDANGHTNIVRYDDNGNEVMKAIPGISTNYFAFDANNNQIWHQDARGFVTTRAYDSRGNLTNIVDALSNVTAIAYNELNKPTSVTDALGHTTRFGYNSKGQTTNAVNALGGQAFFNRDAQGRVTSVTDFNGHTAIFDYTGACSCSKPSRTINPDGTSRTYEYNPRGQTLRETDELGHSTFFAYDGGGHLLSVRNVMSNTTTYAYAGALKISETDPLGRTTYYAYDAVNRQIAITNAMGSVVRFEYDNGTNRTVVLDPVNNATRFYYDAANRLSHQVDSWGRTNSFAYDPSGNRIEAIDRNGRRRTFAYDGLNRSTNELWWEGTKLVRTIEFTYSVLGLLTGARDPASLLTFHFDAWNRLERAVQSGGVGLPEFTLTYAYDGVGNAVSVSDNLGVQLTSEYDVRDRLTRCVWQGGGIPGASIQFAYDATGNRTRILRAADTIGTNVAVQSYYSYNTVGAVTNIIHVNGTGVSLAEYQYQRDPAQQIILRATGNLLSSFTYDFTGQITNVTYSPPNQPAESYHYDANGNRIGGGYIVITNNQITANGALAYSYDAEGSLVARTNAFTGSRTAYAYDHRQRLVRVLDYDSSGNCTQTVDFGYDLLNRRTSKIVNGVVFRYLYDRESAWADLGPNGGVAVHYLVTGNLDDMIVRFRATEGLGWYLSDVVGTVRDISDSTGRIVSHLDYSEFGSLLSVTGSSSFDRFSFTGREFDQEIGLYFNRARFYDPNSHVFISEDPLGFVSGDFNLHRYANNNPISGRDRTGTVAMFEEGLQVGSSIGASTAAAPLGVLTGADAVGAAIAPDLAMLASAAEGSFAQQVFLAQIRSVIAGFIRSLPNRYLQELGVGFLKDWIRSTFGRKLSIMIFSGGWV